MKRPKPTFHPSCPKKLKSALRKAKYNQSLLARNLGVNKGSISKLILKGIEPKEEELRLKVFLPRHPRKTKTSPDQGEGRVRVELPPHRKWWNKQPKEFKDTIIETEWLKSNR